MSGKERMYLEKGKPILSDRLQLKTKTTLTIIYISVVVWVFF